MEDLRQLVQEEGREARNIVAFHVTVDTPASRTSRKPPFRTGVSTLHRKTIAGSVSSTSSARRGTRSASAGRDKRSELQARYWALLFGNLQRAVGEIYNTVEAHENLSECQEVILVLENYTRDFKALCEWFRLKWEYDNTPPPQRPLSLAWEVRKTDFVRPESRKTSSGKSSPSLSGKSSPNISPSLTSGKISPKMLKGSGGMSPKSPQNKEFTALKYSTSKNDSKAGDIKPVKITEEPMVNIKEIEEQVTIVKNENNEVREVIIKDLIEDLCHDQNLNVELGTAVEFPSLPAPKKAITVSRTSKTNLKSNELPKVKAVRRNKSILSSQAKCTISVLNLMENDFLKKKSIKDAISKDDNIKIFHTTTSTETKNSLVNCETSDPSKSHNEESSSKTDSGIESFVTESNNDGKIYDLDLNDTERSTSQATTTEVVIDEAVKAANNSDKKETVSNEVVKHSVDVETRQELANDQNIKAELEKEVSQEFSVSSGSLKPAYSQAAAKPKLCTPTKSVSSDKTLVRNKTQIVSGAAFKNSKSSTSRSEDGQLMRSKTMTEIRQTKVVNQVRTSVKTQSSYPFNSTMGRSKLFERDSKSNRYTGNKLETPKIPRVLSSRPQAKDKKETPSSRFQNLTSKTQLKNGKHELVKLNNLDNPDLNRSADTIISSSIDLTRIQSNESIKTLVPDSASGTDDYSEVLKFLQEGNINSSDDGWLTVKSRRLSKSGQTRKSLSHWADRFNQPSATASLPTLSMLDMPITNTSNKEVDRIEGKSTIDETLMQEYAKNTPIEVPKDAVKKATEKIRERPLIIRQRSDLVRSKTKNLIRKKLSAYDKIVSHETGSLRSIHSNSVMKKRLHSSLESLETGPGKNEKCNTTSTDDSFEKSDVRMKSLKIRLESFKRERYLSNSNYIKRADLLEIAAMTSQIEENERKISIALDLQSEEDQRKLSEEEDRLNQQIKELQQCDIDVDTETDDTETDAEIICEELNIPEEISCDEEIAEVQGLEGSEDCIREEGEDNLEARYEPVLAGLSWDERINTLAALEALVARHPGRAQQLHAKLSQGMRRRGSLQETLKRYQEKQERAQNQRQELQEERAKKLHQLLARVEDVKAAKNQLIEEKRLRMEHRLQKAAENRDQHLKDIVRKAHDEDEKLREILFIKQLQAEQARHEILAQVRRHTSRMRQLRRERLRRLEQLVARRAAAGARRSALEAARGGRLRALQERRRQRHERARDKRDQVLSRSQRLGAALSNKQRVDDIHVELEPKSKGRNMPNNREAPGGRHAKRTKSAGKILQNGIDNKQPSQESDKSSACDLAISKEKAKSQKKRIRKFRQKIVARGEEYECSYEPPPVDPTLCTGSRLQRPIQQIANLTQKHTKSYNLQNVPPNKMETDAKSSSAHSSMSDLSKAGSKSGEGKKGPGKGNQLDRALSELTRALQKKIPSDNLVFLKLGGFNAIGGILAAALEGECTDKTLIAAVQILSGILCGFLQGCEMFIRSNRMVLLLDLLNQTMAKSSSCGDAAQALCDCAFLNFDLINARKSDLETNNPELMQRTHSMISYACASGVVSSAGRRATASFRRLVASMAEAALLHRDDYVKSHLNDISARGDMARELKATEMCGALSALQNDPQGQCSKADRGADDTEERRLRAALRLMNAAARVDVKTFQDLLGRETEGIQFRTAASRLLAKYAPSDGDLGSAAAVPQTALTEALLYDLIAAVGYFVVNNEANQETISGGDPPGAACARRLAALPARCCAAGRAADARAPAAIAALAACWRARAILGAEINVQALEEFVWSDAAKEIPLAIMLRSSRRKTSDPTAKGE